MYFCAGHNYHCDCIPAHNYGQYILLSSVCSVHCYHYIVSELFTFTVCHVTACFISHIVFIIIVEMVKVNMTLIEEYVQIKMANKETQKW